MRVCYRFSTGVTEAGKRFDAFVATLILLNVAAVVAESEPALGGKGGPSEGRFQAFFDAFEVRSSPCRGVVRAGFWCSEASRAGFGRADPAFRSNGSDRSSRSKGNKRASIERNDHLGRSRPVRRMVDRGSLIDFHRFSSLAWRILCTAVPCSSPVFFFCFFVSFRTGAGRREQAFSVLVFTAEISMRLFIAPISSRYSFSRWTYLTSFFGVIDVASIAPW